MVGGPVGAALFVEQYSSVVGFSEIQPYDRIRLSIRSEIITIIYSSMSIYASLIPENLFFLCDISSHDPATVSQ